MAPSREACAVAMAMAAPFIAIASNVAPATGNSEKRRRTSSDSLQRTVSDVSYELHHHSHGAKEKEAEKQKQQQLQLRPVPEVGDAKCECCGMKQKCTPEYIRGVRDRFAGRWVCGLCAEAVTEEAGKNGGKLEEALRTHMGVCKRFNGFGRPYPVLFQAEAMKEILRRRAKLGPRSRSSINPMEVRAGRTGGIARSSSCAPFIIGESNNHVSTSKN